MSASQYDVCVVGLGPTGLTMAHLLALQGLKVLALEREPRSYGMARAVYTDDECLRIMQNAGLADELHADMITDLPVQWIKADGSVLAQFGDPSRRNGWPTSNFLYQPAYEATLERRLLERPGVTIRRGRAVLQFDQDERGVTITHQGCAGAGYGRGAIDLLDGTTEQDRAAYVVAADGGRSIARLQYGIEMDGQSFPQRWLVIDLHARDGKQPFSHLPYFDFICDPDMPTVSCPQPGNRHRFEFMLQDLDATADFESEATARRLLARYVDPDQVVIDRRLVYTFNALIAQRWRHGRVLLAGDAAHMTPQFVGQGMNSGLRDADNLSWKLADVVRGADPRLLDSYESERKPHARAMIKLSVFNKDVVSTRKPWVIHARDWGFGTARHLPLLRTVIGEAKMKPKPRHRRGGYFGTPRGVRGVEGTLLPQPQVRTAQGRPVRYDDAVGAGWVVIGIGVDPRQVLDPAEWASVSPSWVSLHENGTRGQGKVGDPLPQDGLVDLELIDGGLRRWLRRAGARRGSVIVVRPDKYVFSVITAGEQAAAVELLRSLYPARKQVGA